MGHQKLSHLSTRLHVGVLENALAINEKTSEAPHIRRQSVSYKENPSGVLHRRSQLVSPSRHVTVRNGETLGTMLGAVV